MVEDLRDVPSISDALAAARVEINYETKSQQINQMLHLFISFSCFFFLSTKIFFPKNFNCYKIQYSEIKFVDTGIVGGEGVLSIIILVSATFFAQTQW